MIRVLIADDEPKILQGLSNQVRKLPLNIEVCGLARDGLEAFDLVKSLRPDILLLDICMPFLSGLEMLQKLQNLRLHMKVIIITGFEEFEYAKKALEMSVCAYLLKPVDMEELKARLETAVDELLHERNQRRFRDFAADQLLKRKDILTEVFLMDVIRDEFSSEEITDYCRQFDIDPSLQYGLTLIVDVIENGAHPDNYMFLRYEVEGVIKDALASCANSYFFPDGRGNVLWLFDRNCMGNIQLKSQMPSKLSEQLMTPFRIEYIDVPYLSKLADTYEKLISLVFDGKQTSRFVAEAQNYIAKEFSKSDLGLVEVADIVGITPTYLSRLMKQELGLSFNKYLTKIRINFALNLINQGMMLKDIAREVGYSSPFYFSTAFKRTLGAAPIEYRKTGNSHE